MSIQDEIDRTKSQIGDHEEAIRKLHEHGRSLCLKKMGLSVGDRIIVLDREGREMFEAEVTGVRGWNYTFGYRPEAVKVKKDGTAGQQSAGYITKWRKK